MAQQSGSGSGPRPVDEVELDEAFLDIPDKENQALIDAWKTYVYTLVSTAVFVAVVFLFIL